MGPGLRLSPCWSIWPLCSRYRGEYIFTLLVNYLYLQVKRETIPAQAVKLIEKHSFDVDSLPSHLLASPAVWEAGIARLPLRRTLHHLHAMARRGLLSSPDSAVLTRLLQALSSPLALKASQLQPGEIQASLTQAERRWAPLPGRGAEVPTIPCPHPTLITSLEHILHSSFTNVPQACGRVLLLLDTRPTLASNSCWGAPGLSCSKAAALTILGLRAGGAEVGIHTLETRGWREIGVVSETVGSLAGRLVAGQGAQVMEISCQHWGN